MTISDFVAYVKQLWKNQPDTSTPLSAERLLHMETGIKGNSDAIERLAAAVVSQIVNDPNKIASMAALYALNQKIGDTAQLPDGAANVVAAIAKQNSDVGVLYSNMQTVSGKFPTDISYIESVMPRIKDMLNTKNSIISDIKWIIENKGLKSAEFGFGNCTYSDIPDSGVTYGYIRYFKHSDSYVTVILFPELTQNIFIRRFNISTGTWTNNWFKTNLIEVK